ncbi:MAG TPA: trypsin-like serine protease [Myxococcota bacterium]|nr:trypsin-like serine protease [Myxococcota bacterium]
MEAAFPSAGALLYATGDVTTGGEVYAYLCSAVLIAPDVVLTAGHCVASGWTSVTRYWYTPTADLRSLEFAPGFLPPGAVPVRGLVEHPDFQMPLEDGLASAADLSVYFLASPVPEARPARLLPRSMARALRAGAEVQIVGYGRRTVEPVPFPGGVRKARATSEITAVMRDEMRIGGDAPGQHKCHGDSGGPTFLHLGDRWYLVGITSRQFDDRRCAAGGIDTRVDAYAAWIAQVLQDGCEAIDADHRCRSSTDEGSDDT